MSRLDPPNFKKTGAPGEDEPIYIPEGFWRRHTRKAVNALARGLNLRYEWRQRTWQEIRQKLLDQGAPLITQEHFEKLWSRCSDGEELQIAAAKTLAKAASYGHGLPL